MLLMLFADCEDGLSRLPLVKIQHCFREANKRAYALDEELYLGQDFAVFLVPTFDVSMLLSLDSAGVVYNWCFGRNIFAEMITFLLLCQGIVYAASKNAVLY
uniref:Uncharacterized protein n=1 Tax=Quercus lobata TaxID=97700 RepID=A0A7N2QYS4_QUELO